MVRQNALKTNAFVGLAVASILVFSVIFAMSSLTYAAEQGVDFQVNLQESLTVSLTVPDNGAEGSLSYNSVAGKWVSALLRNMINLNISSNNPAGFTASMTSSSATSAALTNSMSALPNDTIPTLSSDWTRSDTSATKFWGWSTNDDSETGTYHQVALKNATPNTLVSSTGSVNQNVYFGAKADSTIAAGTYEGTVIISVVTGVISDPGNPAIPVDPVVPGDLTPGVPTYDGGVTAYTSSTTNSTNHTSTNTTKINTGNTTQYSYADPAGATTTVINEGTPLATGLAVTSAIAATTGIFFLIAAKRRKDDDDEEEEY